MLTACNGTFKRYPDGWRYRWGDLVPGAVDVWDEQARMSIGMLAPELHPDALLTINDVAALAGVAAASIVRYRQRGAVPEPQGHIGRSPWWTRPVIDHWLATRPGHGRPSGS